MNPTTPPQRPPHDGQRADNSPALSLKELTPPQVVDGVKVGNGFEAAPVQPVGAMRETCPHCTGQALQLVLRNAHVIRTHLFCPTCTRCYDAVYDDGSSALMFGDLPAVY